jgi:hypothetical protein
MPTWSDMRRRFGTDVRNENVSDPVGLGNGTFGQRRVLGVVAKATRGGVYIRQGVVPFHFIFRPFLIPWGSIHRITIVDRPRYSWDRGNPKDVDATLFMASENLLLTIPWRIEFNADVPEPVQLINKLRGNDNMSKRTTHG